MALSVNMLCQKLSDEFQIIHKLVKRQWTQHNKQAKHLKIQRKIFESTKNINKIVKAKEQTCDKKKFP